MILWTESRSLGTGASAEALIVRGKNDSPLNPLRGSTAPAAAAAAAAALGIGTIFVRERESGSRVVERCISNFDFRWNTASGRDTEMFDLITLLGYSEHAFSLFPPTSVCSLKKGQRVK